MDDSFLEEKRIKELWTALRNDLRRRGADPETAEDLAQETWLIALRNRPEDHGRLLGWLRTVSGRLLTWSRRREDGRRHREARIAREEVRACATDPDESASRIEARLEELAEPYRTTLRLRFVEERSVSEISRLMAASPAAVRTRLKRGIVRLRSRTLGPPHEERRLPALLAWMLALPRRTTGRDLRLTAVGMAAIAGVVLVWERARPERAGTTASGESALADVAGGANERAPLPALASAPEARTPRSDPPTSKADAGSRRFLRGTVRTTEGEPVVGATVHVGSEPLASDGPETTSDAEGRFAIEVAGSYVWAERAEHWASPFVLIPSLASNAEADLRLVAAHAWVEIAVLTHAGEPVAGARVLLAPARPSLQAGAADGRLELSGAAPELCTDALGRARLPFPDRLPQEAFVIPPDGPAWSGTLEVTEEGEVARIALPQPCALEGVCVDAAGQPVWKAEVTALELGGRVQRVAETDAEGRFRLQGLAPGEFVLRAVEGAPGTLSAVHKGILEGPLANLRLELSERATIAGRVFESGAPAADLVVESVGAVPSPSDVAVRAVRTARDGSFVIGGVQSRQRLRVYRPDGRIPLMADVFSGAGCVRLELAVTAEVERHPFELEFTGPSDGWPRLIELRARHRPGVVLAPEPGTALFRTPDLEAGEYALSCWSPELGVWREPLPIVHAASPTRHLQGTANAGTLRVRLTLPGSPDLARSAEQAEVAVESEVFGLDTFGPDRPARAWRILQPEHDGLVRSALLHEGVYTLALRGEGLVELRREVRVSAGRTEVVELAPSPGVEVMLALESHVDPEDPRGSPSRGVFAYDHLEIEITTSTDTRRLTLRGGEQRRDRDGAVFPLSVPRTPFEIRVAVLPDPGRRTPFVERAGSRRVELEELLVPRPRIVVAMRNQD